MLLLFLKEAEEIVYLSFQRSPVISALIKRWGRRGKPNNNRQGNGLTEHITQEEVFQTAMYCTFHR